MTEEHASSITLDEAMAGLPSDFAFFRDRFLNDVQPDLALREDARRLAAKKAKSSQVQAVVVGVVLAAAGVALFQHPMGAIAGALAAIGIWWWGHKDLEDLKSEAKLMLVTPISREFGMDFQHSPGEPLTISRFRNLGLVPSWDRASFEDQLTGTRKDTPFEFFEAHLKQRRTQSTGKGGTRTKYVTVFRGQCLVAHFPKQFHGVTKVYRDAGMFNALTNLGETIGGKGQRVRLEDPEFEKAFEVFSTDQVEARFLLTPDFMERLLALEQAFEGKKLRCAFSGGEMFLAVEGKNLFEAGSMFRPMDDLGRVREILQDFAALFLLIDAMTQRLTPDSLRN